MRRFILLWLATIAATIAVAQSTSSEKSDWVSKYEEKLKLLTGK